MSLTPFRARTAFSAFLLIGAAIGGNILYLQDEALVSAVARSKAEQVKLWAEAHRERRLALDAKEMPAAKAQTQSGPQAGAETPAMTKIVPLPAVADRTGRFAPSAGQIERTSMPATEAEMRMPDVVKAIQQKLGQRGYEPGTPDGVTGVVTRAAIMAYEHDYGLPLTGEPSENLLHHLQSASGGKPVGAPKSRQPRSGNAEQIIRTVQQSLAQLGYFGGKIDGRPGDDTVRSIREYEMDAGLVPTGRVSAPLLMKLARSTSGPKAASR